MSFQKVEAYRLAMEIAIAVDHAKISHTELRAQAQRASVSAFLEALGHVSPANAAHVASLAKRVRDMIYRLSESVP